MEKKIQKTTEELLQLLNISGAASVEITDDTVNIVLDTEDSGMVIGHHGDILESLQMILSLCVAKNLGEFKRVSLEVGDYKKNRTGLVEQLAQQAKQRALEENRDIALPNLKAWERRVVHLMFQEDQEVVSESIGEGKERTLIVRPR